MTIEDFKKANSINALNFYQSKSSERKVASHGNLMLVTTEGFDPKGEVYVYRASGELQDSAEQDLHWVSNKPQAEAEFTL